MNNAHGIPELKPPARILMGPGPSNVHPRVYAAMSAPIIGHLDPYFLEIMNETMDMLRELFQTKNELTIPVSGTGSSGMETCFVNLVEPGDEAIVCVNGVFGERMCDVASRCGTRVTRVEAPWGRIIEPSGVKEALKKSRPKVIAIVHAETSTGVWQPLEEISELAHKSGALFLVDTVTSLGGCEVKVDDWGIDACYSGTQKCLSCPPGLSPVTFSGLALAAIEKRKTKVQSWYLDMTMVRKYWGSERLYHHTAPINMIYGLREGLRLIHEEGLDDRFNRHRKNHEALAAGLNALGLRIFSQEGYRLHMLNTVAVPAGIDEPTLRKSLLEKSNIEVGGGLGALKGKIFRVGLMGHTSRAENVLYFLSSLERALADQGHKFEPGCSLKAAGSVY